MYLIHVMIKETALTQIGDLFLDGKRGIAFIRENRNRRFAVGCMCQYSDEYANVTIADNEAMRALWIQSLWRVCIVAFAQYARYMVNECVMSTMHDKPFICANICGT